MIVGGFTFLSSDPRALDPKNERVYEAITLVAPTTNTGTVYVGSNISQIIPLPAGASLTLRHDVLTDIYVQDSTSKDQILWYTGKECCCCNGYNYSCKVK
jgi:hypothetical protein